MKKRILPVLLALALVMSMIPMAFATTDCGCTPGNDSDGNPITCDTCTTDAPCGHTGCKNAAGSTEPDPSESKDPVESEEPGESEEPSGPVCTGEANCPAAEHTPNECKSQCTMSASCTNNEGHHKTNCVAACTYEEDVDDGSACPNTSGDPTVHKAGCAKANVSDSIVLNPTNPAESAEPSEEPTESEEPSVEPSEEPSEEPTTPAEITKAEDFSDVSADDWFAEDLTSVIEKGWLKGNDDGSFDPEGDVSGQQAVVFISRMLGKDLVTDGENWADEAMAWAAEDGLTEGIEITSEGIARKDLILLLWRAAGKPASEQEISFTDADELEGEHLAALKWAVENGIIMGNDDGTFAPVAATNRGEVCAILVRYDAAVNK